MSAASMAALSVRVTGRVQGVGYRDFARRSAERLGLVGWVRNEYDGSVYAVAEGSRDNLKEWLDELKVGPRSSRVDAVQDDWKAAEGNLTRFSIRY